MKASTYNGLVIVDIAAVSVTVPLRCRRHLRPAKQQKHVSKSEHPIGAMEEVSGKVQKASTHASGVGVDLAGLERDAGA